MDKMKKRLRNEKGFTLIEIIAVLVVLGILALVAIPKYMDLADDARVKAGQGAIAEIKGRCSLAYAQLLLSKSGGAVTGTEVASKLDTDVGGDFGVSVAANGQTVTITVNTVDGQSVTGVSDTYVVPSSS